MSTKGAVKIECPHCGEKFDADFWTVVRGDRDHQVKDLILTGEFNLLMCPHCSVMFPHEEPFIYMDPLKGLLAFVMPETYLEKKDEWIARMKADYEPLRAGLAAGQGIPGEPLCLFGLGQIGALLEADLDREEETEVMEFMAREAGLQLLPLTPSVARELDLPFSLPMPSGLGGRAAALKAAADLAGKNTALPRLKKLVAALAALKEEKIPFLKS